MTIDRRAAIEADLENYIMSVGTDAEIAADHGVSIELVRELRRLRRRNLDTTEIEQRVRELVQLTAWVGTRHGLIVRVLDGAIARARRRAA